MDCYLWIKRSNVYMSNLQELYKKFQGNRLLEARTTLLEKGVYPFEIFLKEHAETIHASEQIVKLEEVASLYKNHAPTLYMFVKQSTDVLLESNIQAQSVKSSMTNYAFICESIGTCLKQAAVMFKEKHDNQKTIHSIYGKNAVDLLEFCFKKSKAYKLLEGNADPVIRNLSRELSGLSIENLNTLCESVPAMKLYVSNSTHKELAISLLVS